MSLFITGMQFGDEVAMHVSRGAIFGMTGVLCSIIATWAMLNYTSVAIKCYYWFHSLVCKCIFNI